MRSVVIVDVTIRPELEIISFFRPVTRTCDAAAFEAFLRQILMVNKSTLNLDGIPRLRIRMTPVLQRCRKLPFDVMIDGIAIKIAEDARDKK